MALSHPLLQAFSAADLMRSRIRSQPAAPDTYQALLTSLRRLESLQKRLGQIAAVAPLDRYEWILVELDQPATEATDALLGCASPADVPTAALTTEELARAVEHALARYEDFLPFGYSLSGEPTKDPGDIGQPEADIIPVAEPPDTPQGSSLSGEPTKDPGKLDPPKQG